jgi:DNA repair exonuclease SbcCD ATPase subunit
VERNNAQLALRQAGDEVQKTRSSLSEIEHRRQTFNARLNELRKRLSELADLIPEDVDGFLDISATRVLLLREQERNSSLERALFIRQSSSSQDRVATMESRVAQLRQSVEVETARLAALERAQDAARQVDTAAKSVANEVLTEQFDIVLPLLKELYRRLRPHTDWREIEIDFGGTVRASLNFTVGEGRNPQFLFSSGQRRAAGIAFLLAVHLSRPWCKLRSLLLDDPVQHIDDYRALNLVEVLSAIRRTGRQVVIAVEDSALADLLCRRLRSTGSEPGVRLELATSKDGSAHVERRAEVFALPQQVIAEAS